MKLRAVFLLYLLTISLIGCSQEPKLVSPVLDTKSNIRYYNQKDGKNQTIFPVMLYSFINWDEIKNETFWREIEKWGVNVVYSWDASNQSRLINYSNKYGILPLLNYQSTSKNSAAGFVSLPDEPIGAGTADFTTLKKIKNNLPLKSLKLLNLDVGPFYYRQKNSKSGENIFKSKLNCAWCSRGKGSQLSYDETVSVTDIVSFDFYPFRPNGKIDRNISGFGSTSVGAFTKLLKKQYPNKPIWAVVQTMWFDPFNEKFQGNIINRNIIRNLTFDAIVNGADGVSFFGHGQIGEYENKEGYAFLKGKNIQIWKQTLQQTFELGKLQKEYDNILLQDNMYSSSNTNFSYSVKKVNDENKYYVFVVNHLDKSNTVLVRLPSNLKLVNPKTLAKVGVYDTPALPGSFAAEHIDFTKDFTITSTTNQSLTVNLGKYSVAIFSFTN